MQQNTAKRIKTIAETRAANTNLWVFPHSHKVQRPLHGVAGSLVVFTRGVEELADRRLPRRWIRSWLGQRRCCAVDFHALAAELFHEDGPEVLQM